MIDMNKPLPLAGIRVVEFVHMVMGPTCGLVLGDLGADVIKVEPAPDGDNTRRIVGAGAGFYPYFNRNKRSLAIDLKHPDGRRAVARLIATADVVTENFRPGSMDALGLGYEPLKALNPRLIYGSLKGFLAGPYQHRSALDEVVQMMAGLAYMTGPPGRPLRAGTSVNDIMGGMFAAIAIMAALRERDRTGAGQMVTSSLYENCAFLVGQHMAQEAVTGKPATPMPQRVAAWAIYDIFETSDGGQLFVGIVTDTQWATFCEAFDRPDLKADAVLSSNAKRVGERPRLMPIVGDIFKRHTKAELAAICERIGLPFAPVSTPHDLFDDPHLNASGGLLDVALPDGRRTKLPGLPMELDGQRLGLRLDAPTIGEHGREILAELGYAVSDIERMIESKVIVTTQRG